MIDVGELMLDSDFVKCLKVRRPTGAFDNAGVWNTTYTDLVVQAAIQPVGRQDVARLPTGTSINNTFSVWSATELRAADGKTTESDVIIDGASYYRVIAVEPRGQNGYSRVWAEGFNP